LSVGNLKSLEAKLQLQEKQNQALTKAQAETDEFVLQLDEEVEGFQANIMSLQSKLEKANKRIKDLENEVKTTKSDGEKKDETKDDGKRNINQLAAVYFASFFKFAL
jgi:chromosome segregation ATPase